MPVATERIIQPTVKIGIKRPLSIEEEITFNRFSTTFGNVEVAGEGREDNMPGSGALGRFLVDYTFTGSSNQQRGGSVCLFCSAARERVLCSDCTIVIPSSSSESTTRLYLTVVPNLAFISAFFCRMSGALLMTLLRSESM